MDVYIFGIAFVVIAAAVLAMAVGVIFGGRRIQGSCGGLGNLPGVRDGCPACPRRRQQEVEAGEPSIARTRHPPRLCRGGAPRDGSLAERG